MTSAECAQNWQTKNFTAANCDILTNLLVAGRKVSASISALPASLSAKGRITPGGPKAGAEAPVFVSLGGVETKPKRPHVSL